MKLSKAQQKVVDVLREGRHYIAWTKYRSPYGLIETASLMPNVDNPYAGFSSVHISVFRALRRMKAIRLNVRVPIRDRYYGDSAVRGITGTWHLAEQEKGA